MSSYLLIMLLLLACAEPGPDAPVGEPSFVCPQPAGSFMIGVEDDAGHPLPDAPIGLAVDAWSLAGTTDLTGRLRVDAPAHAKVTVLGVPSAPGEACAGDRVFVVAGAERRDVEVVDTAGAPVAGAVLVAAVPRPRGRWYGQATHVATDERGRALIYARPGTRVGAQVEGAVMGMGERRIVVEDTSSVVEGIVSDAEGRPLPGATVSARWSGSLDPRRVDPLDALDRTPGEVRADDAGRFKIRYRSGSGSSLNLRARADGYVASATDFMVLPGQTLWRRFDLEPARLVALRCDGLPDDSCATVDPDTHSSCDGSDDVRHTTVDGVEHLAFACPPEADTLLLAGLDATWSDTGATARLDFRAWTGGVRGRAPGQEDCAVRVEDGDLARIVLRAGALPDREVKVAADGTFVVTGLASGTWRVSSCTGGGGGCEVGGGILDVGDLE